MRGHRQALKVSRGFGYSRGGASRGAGRMSNDRRPGMIPEDVSRTRDSRCGPHAARTVLNAWRPGEIPRDPPRLGRAALGRSPGYNATGPPTIPPPECRPPPRTRHPPQTPKSRPQHRALPPVIKDFAAAFCANDDTNPLITPERHSRVTRHPVPGDHEVGGDKTDTERRQLHDRRPRAGQIVGGRRALRDKPAILQFEPIGCPIRALCGVPKCKIAAFRGW